MTEYKDDKVKVGAVWEKSGPKGTFYTGTLEPTAARDALVEGKNKLLIFSNGYKEQDKHPDYIVYLASK